MTATTGTIAVNGAELYYEVAGSGPAVVLVHAGIADSRMWDAQFAALAEFFTVVRYDMRGFGRTPMVAGDYAHRHDLLGLLDALNIDQAALVGCSMGGEMVLDFTLEFPDRVSALVPVASGVSGFEYNGPRPRQWEALVAADEQGDVSLFAELEVQIWVDGPQRGPDQVPSSIRDLVREMDLIALSAPQDLGKERPLEPPAVMRLNEIQVPTLVIIGDLDQPRIIVQAEYTAQHIPHARDMRLATAHLPNLELPDEFTSIVGGFLRERLLV